MSINRILNIGLLLITAAAGAAYAEVQAEFHLPFEAHWGQLHLGSWRLQTGSPQISHGSPLFVVKGPEKTSLVMPMLTDYNGNSLSNPTKSYMTLVKINGDYFVREYRSGSTGKTFSFGIPKSKHHLGMADEYVIWSNAAGR